MSEYFWIFLIWLCQSGFSSFCCGTVCFIQSAPVKPHPHSPDGADKSLLRECWELNPQIMLVLRTTNKILLQHWILWVLEVVSALTLSRSWHHWSASLRLVSHLAFFLDGLFPCLPLLLALLLVSRLGGDSGQVRVVDPRHALGLLGGQASGGEDI